MAYCAFLLSFYGIYSDVPTGDINPTEISSIVINDAEPSREEMDKGEYPNASFVCSEDIKKRLANACITSLRFHRKMYQPNKIEAEILFNLRTESTDEMKFLPELVTNLENHFYEKIVELNMQAGNGNAPFVRIADKYYVHSVESSYGPTAKVTGFTLKLTIYSIDNKLTLNKTCMAYNARRLGRDLFADEETGKKFLGQNTITTLGDYMYAFGLKAHVQRNKDTGGSASLDDTPLLSRRCCLLNIVSGTKEYRQPYMVQYNESYYDFLARMANKNGEFFYFDDGKLTLGLNKEEELSLENDVEYSSVEYINEDLQSSDASVDDYSFDYSEENDPDDSKKIVYNVPYNEDEYLEKNDNDLQSFRNRFGWEAACRIEAAYRVTQVTGVSSLIDEVSKAVGEGLFDSEIIDADGIHARGDDLIENAVSLSDEKNSTFYSTIRKKEEQASLERLEIYFEDFIKNFAPNETNYKNRIKLGSVITTGGDEYVVVEIDMNYEKDNTPMIKVIALKYQEMADELRPIPFPLKTTLHISHAQPGFIAESDDYKGLGRVRTYFAWQRIYDTSDGEYQYRGDSSPWIRVRSPFATTLGGMRFRPEKNDEVMIDFENGNIEKPIVIGYLCSPYNFSTANEDNLIKSQNGHTLTLRDSQSDGEGKSIIFPALSFVPKLYNTPEDDNLLDRKSGGAITFSDHIGAYTIELNTAGRSINISSPYGKINMNAFTGIKIWAPNGNVSIIGRNVNITAGNAVKLTSGTNVRDRRNKFSTYMFATMFGNVFTAALDMAVDLSFYRSVFEIFLRPLEGSTIMKSYKNIKIESGSGDLSSDVYAGYLKKNRSTKERKYEKLKRKIRREIDSNLHGDWKAFLQYVAGETGNNFPFRINSQNVGVIDFYENMEKVVTPYISPAGQDKKAKSLDQLIQNVSLYKDFREMLTIGSHGRTSLHLGTTYDPKYEMCSQGNIYMAPTSSHGTGGFKVDTEDDANPFKDIGEEDPVYRDFYSDGFDFVTDFRLFLMDIYRRYFIFKGPVNVNNKLELNRPNIPVNRNEGGEQ